MKRLIISFLALLLAAMSLYLSSCIYDAPGDKFYRTLWTAQEEILGKITLDFLCDGNVCIKAQNSGFDDYGTYQSDGLYATLTDLSLTIGDRTLNILEAHRNGDNLTLTCLFSNSQSPLIIPMTRLSAYQD